MIKDLEGIGKEDYYQGSFMNFLEWAHTVKILVFNVNIH